MEILSANFKLLKFTARRWGANILVDRMGMNAKETSVLRRWTKGNLRRVRTSRLLWGCFVSIDPHRGDRCLGTSSRHLSLIYGYCGGDLLFLFAELAEIASCLDVEPKLRALFEEFAEFEGPSWSIAAATEHDFVDAAGLMPRARARAF